MNLTAIQEPTALTCNLEAIRTADRQAHETLAQRLFIQAYQEKRELADGYAFRFTAVEYPALVAYIANERLCCPFFTFELEIAPNQGPVWLRLRGDEMIKAFLKSQFETVS